ncbi:MAG: MetQ/NlpA family ABC transporter substrate-binding protein [Hungatella sp.]
MAIAAVTALSLFGCSSGSGNAPASTAAAGSEAAGSEAAKEPAEVTTVKVGVVGEYSAQWDTINELLKDDGIQVELMKFTDYAAPNRALNDGEIDLNAFQHTAFLANDVAQKGYDIVDIGDTIIAPLSIYNNKERFLLLRD